jgi:type IV secretory pathway TraG/TraD family ATPase VirD4
LPCDIAYSAASNTARYFLFLRVCRLNPLLSRPDTVFVVCPSDAQVNLAPLIVGLVEAIRSAALRLSDHSPAGELPLPLLLALDEVANIAPLPSLPAILAEGRARSIFVLCAFQSYGQAEALWSQRTDGLVFGGSGSLFLAGVRDEAVLRRLELLGGRHFVPQVTRSASPPPPVPSAPSRSGTSSTRSARTTAGLRCLGCRRRR